MEAVKRGVVRLMRERTQTLVQPQRQMLMALVTMAAFLMAATWAAAGQIGLGDPQVNGNTVVVPVVLQADASGDVSSLDFRVRYDPSQLRPVMARPGPAAQNADKDVMGNERGPGEFSVVMMGLNRNVVSDGEVANITFERVGQGNAADLRITQTTLANPDALEIPSRGSSRTISFDGSSPPAQDASEQPAQDQSGTGRDPQQGRDQSASPGQTQTDPASPAGQSPATTTADGSPIGGPASPFGGRQAPTQQQQGGVAFPGAGGATESPQQRAADSPAAGTSGDTSDTQRRLQGAIASADAARGAVDAPAGGVAGQEAGSAPQGVTGETAQPQEGQTVDAQIQVAQVRTTTEAGRAAQQETGGASPGATAAQPPQATAPMLPVFIALGAAAVAVLALFVVRKKLFA
jgi:hypothetical protein